MLYNLEKVDLLEKNSKNVLLSTPRGMLDALLKSLKAKILKDERFKLG